MLAAIAIPATSITTVFRGFMTSPSLDEVQGGSTHRGVRHVTGHIGTRRIALHESNESHEARMCNGAAPQAMCV
jgi:hypothetical protein